MTRPGAPSSAAFFKNSLFILNKTTSLEVSCVSVGDVCLDEDRRAQCCQFVCYHGMLTLYVQHSALMHYAILAA